MHDILNPAFLTAFGAFIVSAGGLLKVYTDTRRSDVTSKREAQQQKRDDIQQIIDSYKDLFQRYDRENGRLREDNARMERELVEYRRRDEQNPINRA